MDATDKNGRLKSGIKTIGDLMTEDPGAVECICPRCGAVHKMKLLWIGRGTPKKYCQTCKNYVTSIEPLDFCGLPAGLSKGLEKAV